MIKRIVLSLLLLALPCRTLAQAPETPPVVVDDLLPGTTTNDTQPALEQMPDAVSEWDENGRWARGKDIMRFGDDVNIGFGQTVRNVIVVSGNLIMDGEVTGEVIVINGKATINGPVRQGAKLIMSNTTLGTNAAVRNELISVGGALVRDPGVEIGRKEFTLNTAKFPPLRWLEQWIRNGLLLARPFAHQLEWVWILAGVLLLVNLALASMFPNAVVRCAQAIRLRPLSSFFAGILMLILAAPLVVILAVTGVGLLLVPFVLCAGIAVLVIGKIGVYRFIGGQFGGQLSNGGVEKPLLGVLIGTLLVYVLYMVPFLGFIVWGLVTILAVGCAGVAVATNWWAQREKLAAERPIVSQPIYRAPRTGTEAPSVEPQPTTFASSASAPGVPVEDLDALTLPRAGFWVRFLATLLDLVIFLLLAWAGPAWFFLWLAYHIAMWAWKGTTVGGIVMGLKIVRQDGREINFATALVRALSSVFSALVLFLGFFAAGWSRERLSWHDRIAGTAVVRVPRGMSLV